MARTLLSSYEQYKADTQDFVDWLHRMANGIARKRAKKERRKRMKDPLASPTRSGSPERLVPVSDGSKQYRASTAQMVVMAGELMAAHVGIDPAMMNKLRSAIKRRQKHADYHARRQSNREDNRRHQNIILRLRELLAIFAQPEEASESYTYKSAFADDKHDADSAGESFQPHEPAESDLCTTVDTSAVQTAITDEPTVEELAVWCWLCDCRKIEEDVRTAWDDTRAHSVDEFAIVSALAVREVVSLTEDLQSSFPHMKSASDLHSQLHVKISTERPTPGMLDNLTLDDTIFGLRSTGANIDMVYPSEFCAVNTMLLFARKQVDCVADGILQYQKDGVDQGSIALLWAAVVLAVHSTTSLLDDLEDVDPFTQTMFQMIKGPPSPEIPLWMPCALAISSHFMRMVGKNSVGVAGAVLAKSGLLEGTLLSTIAQIEKGSALTYKESAPSQTRGAESLSARHRKKLTACSDFLRRMSGKGDARVGHFMYTFPATACMLRLASLVGRYQVGMEICSASDGLTYMAHLYTACYNFSLMDYSWKDMNFVILTHPELFKFLPPANRTRTARRAASNCFKLARAEQNQAVLPAATPLGSLFPQIDDPKAVMVALENQLKSKGVSRFLKDIGDYRRDAEFNYGSFALECDMMVEETFSRADVKEKWTTIEFAFDEAASIHASSPDEPMRRDTAVVQMARILQGTFRPGGPMLAERERTNKALSFPQFICPLFAKEAFEGL